jgi:hypothetical protein
MPVDILAPDFAQSRKGVHLAKFNSDRLIKTALLSEDERTGFSPKIEPKHPA